MERFGGSEFPTTGGAARKKRSNTPRRPHTDSHPAASSYYFSPNDQNTLSICKNSRKENGGFGNIDGFNRNGSEKKLKKVKLKLGGVTRTIHANSTTEFAAFGSFSATNCCYGSPQSLKIQENTDTSRAYHVDAEKSLHGVPQRGFSTGVSGFRDDYTSRAKTSKEVYLGNAALNFESVRKSKRIPKRRVLDVGFSDDDEDEEIQYLGRLKASKVSTLYEDEGNENTKTRRNEKILKSSRRDRERFVDSMDVSGSSMSGRYSGTKPRSEKTYEDEDYMEEEEPTSDDEPKVQRETLKKESADSFSETLIDLPNGSLPASRKKQKEKLSEVEQQLKKVEAAQRRRLQSEKAAKEAEAEAIRKILGQDSARKKKEEKMKKQRDEAAQVRAASATTLAPGTVRCVMGPTGTIVTFSEDIGLPSIFNPVPCSYPPPREKCAGPNCTNSYKYRDSKSNLPLCSLLCYRAIRKEMQPMVAC